jgi:UDP-glucose 4-epimerase
MRVLVLGGAGYIGSHMVRFLQEQGDEPIVFDNLSTGHRAAVSDCPLIIGDLLDAEAITRALQQQRPDVVMHFAAKSIVPESAIMPDIYYRTNLSGTMNLLAAMHAENISSLIFSSTAAVYGTPQAVPIKETAALQPISPYGRTKLFMEEMIRDYASAYGLRAISLRYFNAAGAHASGSIGEAHEPETHLIPNILRSVANPNFSLKLFGNQHATPDGTCIRDYIHVSDLCSAHHLAAQRVLQMKARSVDCFNLGLGAGYSVLEVLRGAEAVLGCEIPHRIEAARAGDPPILVADAQRARTQLGWHCEHSALDNIMASAWRWHENQRYG